MKIGFFVAPLVTTRLSPRDQTLLALDHLPKLAPATSQLLARLAHRHCDVRELTSLVERDALLSAQVLRLANSAAFGRVQPIGSVQHAIAMVGVGTMRKFALGSSIANLFSRVRPASSFSMTRFNLHSVATATLVELLADELPVEYARGAFMAGLLHDVGKLIVATNLPRQYENVVSLAALNGTALIECEREVLGMDHAELSQLAIGRWQLADPIRWAACYHHAPDDAASVENTGPDRLGLSRVVNKADAFINYLGMSVLPARMTSDEPPSLEFEGFPYSGEVVLKRFELEWKSLGDLFR